MKICRMRKKENVNGILRLSKLRFKHSYRKNSPFPNNTRSDVSGDTSREAIFKRLLIFAALVAFFLEKYLSLLKFSISRNIGAFLWMD